MWIFPIYCHFAIDGSQKCLVSKKSYFFLGWHKKLPKKTWKIVKAFTSFWIWSSTHRHSCRWTCSSLAFLTPCFVTRTTTFINWVTTLWPPLQMPPELRTSMSFLRKRTKFWNITTMLIEFVNIPAFPTFEIQVCIF